MKIKFRIIGLMIFFLGLSFSQAFASFSDDRVLSDVKFSRTDQHVVIHVTFNFPVRYLRYYPLDHGKEFNIQLEPILTGMGDVSGLNKRDSLSVPDNNPAGLVRVEYEGSDLIKPTLRVVLDKNKNYEVKQGDDFRSLEILLSVKTEDEGNKDAGEAGKKISGPQQREMLSQQK